MSYFFSDIPKGYDTHIALSTFLEVLISISEYPICSAIEFLQYHEFQNKIQFYYLESISYKPIELIGGGDIVRNVLCDINNNYPLTTIVLTELPPYIMDKICNIYLNPIELNKLDFLSKLEFDFTDQRRILDLGMHDHTIQGRLIDEKLSNLVLKFGIVDKNIKPIQLPINEIKTLVTYFHHQFVIKNNNLELVNQDVFSPIKNELTFTTPESKADVCHQNIVELENEIADLKHQLAQAKAKLADKPTDSITQSNTDIHNIQKEAIKQFKRSLATVLIDLDYKGKLRKGDIANYIVPYMKELAFVLADEQQDKADNLTVAYDTLYDNHLKNLGFKQGRQSDDEKQKVNIDLLFKKQLPITE